MTLAAPFLASVCINDVCLYYQSYAFAVNLHKIELFFGNTLKPRSNVALIVARTRFGA